MNINHLLCCSPERSGKYCEREAAAAAEAVAGFSGQSRALVRAQLPRAAAPAHKVSFRLKPLSGEGVLLHSGDTIVALHNGHLQFR